VTGGPSVTIARLNGSPRGGTWGNDRTIVFATNNPGGLLRVSEVGGTPAALTTPDRKKGEIDHFWPSIRNDAFQDGLAFNQRRRRISRPSSQRHVKGHEVPPVTAKEQMGEATTTVGTKTCDLAVEDCVVTALGMREFRTQVLHRSKAVVLHFADEVRVIERPRNAQQCRRCGNGQHVSIVPK